MSMHLTVVQQDERQSHARRTSSPLHLIPPPTGSGSITVCSSPVRKPKLLDQVRTAIRLRHYSLRTEDTYVHWIKRFILFHGKRHPREMGETEIGQFLSALYAVPCVRHVSIGGWL